MLYPYFIHSRSKIRSAIHTKMKKKNNFEDTIADLQNQQSSRVLKQSIWQVAGQKIQLLNQLQLRNASKESYNPHLAYRVICLNLYWGLKVTQVGRQASQAKTGLDIVEEINRLLKAACQTLELSLIRKCMDLLLLKELNDGAATKYIKYWRIKVLSALKNYYALVRSSRERKKASTMLRQMCKEELKAEKVRNDQLIYAQILDVLIEEQRVIMHNKQKHHNTLEAIQHCSNIVGILERAEESVLPRYQEQLMRAYWDLALMHQQLHYCTYARNYAKTALNIAQRVGDRKMTATCLGLIEQLQQQ